MKPLFFPGGTIGDLAVNGTVNDLAMAGAQPMVLSTAFILEEGTPLDDIGRVARPSARPRRGRRAARHRGHQGGRQRARRRRVHQHRGNRIGGRRVDIRPQRATAGDVVIVSGDIGVHGVAVMSCREGLEFGTTIASDTAPLHGLVAAMLATGADVHVLRDPTRGGVAASLNEIAKTAGSASRWSSAPSRSRPRSATPAGCSDSTRCTSPTRASCWRSCRRRTPRVLAAMRAHPLRAAPPSIGTASTEHPGMVVARTALGGTRVVDLPIGEQLPRIC